jgi:hypothetical protein
MNEPDWKYAPEWADRALKRSARFEWLFGDGEKMQSSTGKVVKYGEGSYYKLDDFEFIKMRSDPWAEGEHHIENIVLNGIEDDEHDNVNHPDHYQSDNGIECIDAIRAALGHDGFIAYCRGNTIKYNWRSGSKSSHSEDLKKGAWYSNRAAEELEKSK